jgi:hypothetical protein
LQIPLKEGIGDERDGDFTDIFVVRFTLLWAKKNPENNCYDYLYRRRSPDQCGAGYLNRFWVLVRY